MTTTVSAKMTAVRRRYMVVGGMVLAAVVVAAVLVVPRLRRADLPTSEVEAYLAAWDHFDGRAMAKVVDRPPGDFTTAIANMQHDLRLTTGSFTAGPVRRASGGADATFTAKLQPAGLDPWQYTGRLHLVRTGGKWRVAWTPASLHPDLGPGERFAATRTWPARAAILGDDGTPLAAQTDVVTVGLEPDRISDQNLVRTVLQQQLQVDPAKVTAALGAPGVKPNFFVPIVPVRKDVLARVRPVLEPVPGIFFRNSTARLGPTDGFARQTVGTVGEVTADGLKQLGPPYIQGDVVGLDGLEAAFERQLAGRPSGDIHLVDAAGHTLKLLQQYQGGSPQPLSTTLDARTQQAAEQALAAVAQPAALVALDSTTGEIRAVVSRPLDQPFNRALAGRYPPGSTFKVVTTMALLANGTNSDTPVGCPPTATVGGKVFKNFEGEAPGQIPFHQAFAISCNTAFVTLAGGLPVPALTAAANSFGFGQNYSLPLPAAGGQFPAPADKTEEAAAAIGQGRVQTSPLHMATVAAAAASGTWRPPHLLAADAQSQPTPLDPAQAATLRGLMTEVVRSGTGTAAAVPGQAVAGKTGTAEFGSANPPTTHAWFIGFRGTLAFAILVEGGGVGGRVAAPLAAKFLAAAPA